jgi:hypothetical protein
MRQVGGGIAGRKKLPRAKRRPLRLRHDVFIIVASRVTGRKLKRVGEKGRDAFWGVTTGEK